MRKFVVLSGNRKIGSYEMTPYVPVKRDFQRENRRRKRRFLAQLKDKFENQFPLSEDILYSPFAASLYYAPEYYAAEIIKILNNVNVLKTRISWKKQLLDFSKKHRNQFDNSTFSSMSFFDLFDYLPDYVIENFEYNNALNLKINSNILRTDNNFVKDLVSVTLKNPDYYDKEELRILIDEKYRTGILSDLAILDRIISIFGIRPTLKLIYDYNNSIVESEIESIFQSYNNAHSFRNSFHSVAERLITPMNYDFNYHNLIKSNKKIGAEVDIVLYPETTFHFAKGYYGKTINKSYLNNTAINELEKIKNSFPLFYDKIKKFISELDSVKGIDNHIANQTDKLTDLEILLLERENIVKNLFELKGENLFFYIIRLFESSPLLNAELFTLGSLNFFEKNGVTRIEKEAYKYWNQVFKNKPMFYNECNILRFQNQALAQTKILESNFMAQMSNLESARKTSTIQATIDAQNNAQDAVNNINQEKNAAIRSIDQLKFQFLTINLQLSQIGL